MSKNKKRVIKLRKNFRFAPQVAASLEKDARANGWTETRVIEQLIREHCSIKNRRA